MHGLRAGEEVVLSCDWDEMNAVHIFPALIM